MIITDALKAEILSLLDLGMDSHEVALALECNVYDVFQVIEDTMDNQKIWDGI
jgi:hypothetical protein